MYAGSRKHGSRSEVASEVVSKVASEVARGGISLGCGRTPKVTIGWGDERAIRQKMRVTKRRGSGPMLPPQATARSYNPPPNNKDQESIISDDEIVQDKEEKKGEEAVEEGGEEEEVEEEEEDGNGQKEDNFADTDIPKTPVAFFAKEKAKIIALIMQNTDIKCDVCIKGKYGPAVAICCYCQKFLCSRCHDFHKDVPQSQDHETIELADAHKEEMCGLEKRLATLPFCCLIHRSQELKFYCTSCHAPVCPECTLDRSHAGHNFSLLSDFTGKEKLDLQDTLGDALSAIGQLDKVINNGVILKDEIESQQLLLHASITNAFDKLFDVLKSRKDALIVEGNEIALSKATRVLLQTEALQRARDGLAEASEAVKAGLQCSFSADLLVTKAEMKSNLLELLEAFKKIPLQFTETKDFNCNLDYDNIVAMIEKFGSFKSMSKLAAARMRVLNKNI